MRIGIDARTILNPKKNDAIGAGHYAYQLIRHLLAHDKKNEYVIFFDFRVRQKDVRKFAQENVKIIFYPFSDYKKYLPGAYNEILASAVLSRENLDVLHVMSAETRIPTTYRGKVVVTLHDLGVYHIPECYKKTSGMRTNIVTRFMLGKADHIIAVSEQIKNDAIKIKKNVGEKMTVIYSGLDKRFFDAVKENGKVVPKKFGITKKFSRPEWA